MLRISRATTVERSEQVVLKLEGQVRGPWVEELRRECAETAAGNGHRGQRLVLDLADVSFVDADGVTLLRRLTTRQVVLTNCSPFVSEQLKEVADGEK